MITFFKQKSKKEILQAVIKPLIFSRLILLFIAWFSQYFQPSTQYFPTKNVTEQFAFSSFRFLDVWGRWDSGWYLKIAQQGYLFSNLGEQQGNSFAFFPFYPGLIKLFSLIIPQQFLSQEVWLFLAVAIANLCFLFGLILFYYLVKNTFLDKSKTEKEAKNLASKSVIFLLLFPTSFFFSCAYSEAVFFLLAVGSFFLIRKQKYFLASLVISLASITRPYGILLLLPLLISYFQARKWQISKINWQFFSFLMPILSLGAYAYYCYIQTGDFLAFLHAQAQWSRQLSWPWQSILEPLHFIGYVTPVEKLFTVLSIVILLFSFKLLPLTLAIWANIVNLIPLFSGTVISNLRYILIFPIFIVLTIMSYKKPTLERMILAFFLMLQVLLFSAWCQFYWVA